MSLVTLIEDFNRSNEAKIDLRPSRDGRIGAVLPRTGREILVKDSDHKPEVRVTARDVAALCQEIRQALAPGIALLDAALETLGTVAESSKETSPR